MSDTKDYDDDYRSKTEESKVDCNKDINITHRSLEEWFKNMFEKLGWMVLANKEEKHQDKVLMYIKSIDYFIEHAQEKKRCTKNQDTRDNIMIMIKHANTLKDHTSIFKSLIGGKKRRSSKSKKKI